MRPARIALLTVATLASALVAVPPATAATTGALLFSGTAHISCFGCGGSTGTAALSFTGAKGTFVSSGSASAYYTVNEPPGNACLLTGSATGTVSGFVNVSFAWNRVGALAVVTTTGDFDGSGVAEFVVASPGLPSIPCGGPVDASLAGALVGAGTAPTVPAQCGDGLDNDLDGRTDYPSDPGCGSTSDDSENTDTTSCGTAGPVCVQVVPGAVVQQVDVYGETTGTAAAHHVTGRVDIYRFPLPGGGTTTVPCVLLAADATTVDPCQVAGGTYVSTLATLLNDQEVDQPSPAQGPLLRSVKICAATLTATVAGIGVQNVPAYAVC
jgi:hypothetical protein